MTTRVSSELEGIVNLIRNFKAKPLIPVFEAIINSIQSVGERFPDDIGQGKITVRIRRNPQQCMNFEGPSRKEPEIIGFEIEDNGVGFTPVNVEAFKIVATTHKKSVGGKGLGRFTWLKAFDSVRIESVYLDSGAKKRIKIDFSLQQGIVPHPEEDAEDADEIKTVVYLNHFKRAYRALPTAYKTTDKIAQRILEHCLVAFLNKCAPEIIVDDDEKGENVPINLNELFEQEIRPHAQDKTLNIGPEEFNVVDLKLFGTSVQMHNMSLCANSREVLQINIGKNLGTNVQFDENGRKFVYSVYVTGTYLDKKVLPTRDDFDLPEDESVLSQDEPVSRKQILEAVTRHAQEFLEGPLADLKTRREEMVRHYVAEKNPALRAVVKYCPEVIDSLEPNASDEKIDEVLYQKKGVAEFKIRQAGSALLKTQPESMADFEDKSRSVAEQYEALEKDNLAAYVTYRRFVIDLFKKKLELRDDGKYENENILHDIIFPRKADSDDIDYNHHNLWLIDDRLAFHEFAASDRELKQIIQNGSADRADILAFSEVDPETLVAKSVSVVEFKKPQRENYSKESPQQQVLRIVQQVRSGEKTLQIRGRPIRIVPGETQFLCYAICDFTDAIEKETELDDFQKIQGEYAYYKYHAKLNANVYLISLQQIPIDARKRNFAFFKRLGIDK